MNNIRAGPIILSLLNPRRQARNNSVEKNRFWRKDMTRTSMALMSLIIIALIFTGCDGDSARSTISNVITARTSTDSGVTWSGWMGNGSSMQPAQNVQFEVNHNGTSAPPWTVEQGGSIIASNMNTTATAVVVGTLFVFVNNERIEITVSATAPPQGLSVRLNGVQLQGTLYTGGTYSTEVLLDGNVQASGWTITDSASATVATPAAPIGIFSRSGTFTVTLGNDVLVLQTNADEAKVELTTQNLYRFTAGNEATVDIGNYTVEALVNSVIESGNWYLHEVNYTGVIVADNDVNTATTNTTTLDDLKEYWLTLAGGQCIRFRAAISTAVTMVYDSNNEEVLILLPLWVTAGFNSNVDIHPTLLIAAFQGTEKIFPGTTQWVGATLTMFPEIYTGTATDNGQPLYGRTVIRRGWPHGGAGVSAGWTFNGSATYGGVSRNITVTRQTVATP